jgi:DNA repair protein RadC
MKPDSVLVAAQRGSHGGASVPVPRGLTRDEHEVLAKLLAHSNSQASAMALLRHLPSIGHVPAAEPTQLAVFGLSKRDMALLQLVRETACILAQAKVSRRSTLSNWQALIDYLKTAWGTSR